MIERGSIHWLVLAWVMVIGAPASAEITDVFIFPEEPIEIDPITIFVSGIETGGGITIDNSDFQIDGTSTKET